ncbi:MAG TPA: amidohydrolase [Chthoniobacterales bacterium]
MDVTQWSERVENECSHLDRFLRETRRRFHRYPELSGQETGTTAYLSEQLKLAGVPHRCGREGKGLMTEATTASGPAPAIALRADLDALPIVEANEVDYRSTNPGVMHACGHDAHSAILLGATLALWRAGLPKVAWRGIFQPAEEVGQGALEMINQGALEGVQAIVALHMDPNREIGQVGITAGLRTAYCQDFVIDVVGRGGHGARPHQTVDPIAVAANLVTLIYQALPRQTDARTPLVVTIGSIQGGQSANVIPDRVVLRGTIRALGEAVANHGRETLSHLCEGTARAFRAEVTPAFTPLLPGMANDPTVTELCQRVAKQLLGSTAVITDDLPSMGAEDFAEYTRLVPGCMMVLGCRSPGAKITPLHTPQFNIAEDVLLLGVRLLTQVVCHWPMESLNGEPTS